MVYNRKLSLCQNWCDGCLPASYRCIHNRQVGPLNFRGILERILKAFKPDLWDLTAFAVFQNFESMHFLSLCTIVLDHETILLYFRAIFLLSLYGLSVITQSKIKLDPCV